MRHRNAIALGLFGLGFIGCGPAEIVPMTPPGVAYKKVVGEGMEAEGEQRNKGTIRPKSGPTDVAPSPLSGSALPRESSGGDAK